MDNIAARILLDKLEEARSGIHTRLRSIIDEKLAAYKLKVVAESYGELTEFLQNNVQKMGRTKMIRVRVRQGKVQRRRKVATQPGYTVRNGKVVRMTATERRHRRLAARRAKIKRRSKKSQMMRKRKISLRKRLSMGIK